jgi:hypothetical protein
MEDGLFSWSNFIFQLSQYDLKESIYKAFEPLTRCKPNVDHAPKNECADLQLTYAQKGSFKKKKL